MSKSRSLFDRFYFHNSPKRQCFLEHITSCLCPSASKNKINGLCKTRWVERHNTFTTILELYPYLVKTWDQICYPGDDDREIYPDGNNWKWDSESRNSANWLKHTFTSFEHIVVFMLLKELLEPIRPAHLLNVCKGDYKKYALASKRSMKSHSITNKLEKK